MESLSFCQCHEDNDGTLDKAGEAEIKRRVLLESSAAAIITFAAGVVSWCHRCAPPRFSNVRLDGFYVFKTVK